MICLFLIILYKSESEIGTDKKAGISKFIERRTAQYFTSNFPYFVRVMKYSNVSDTGTLVSSISISSDLFEVDVSYAELWYFAHFVIFYNINKVMDYVSLSGWED